MKKMLGSPLIDQIVVPEGQVTIQHASWVADLLAVSAWKLFWRIALCAGAAVGGAAAPAIAARAAWKAVAG